MSGNEVLSARNLARYGLRRGAYDGANRRRFCLFCASLFGTGIEERREYDSKAERDAAAVVELARRKDGLPAFGGARPNEGFALSFQRR